MELLPQATTQPAVDADIAPLSPTMICTKGWGRNGVRCPPRVGTHVWRPCGVVGLMELRVGLSGMRIGSAIRLVAQARRGWRGVGTHRAWFSKGGTGWSSAGCPRGHRRYRSRQSQRSPSSRWWKSPAYPILSPSYGDGREISRLFIQLGNYPYDEGTRPAIRWISLLLLDIIGFNQS